MELVFIFGLILIIIFILIICDTIKKRHIKFVEEHSVLYHKLVELNKQFKFYKLSEVITESATCNSKRAYDTFNFQKFYTQLMDTHFYSYEDKVNKAEKNKVDYKEYFLQYSNLRNDVITKAKAEQLNFKYKTFVKHEQNLYENLKQKSPIMAFSIQIRCSYTSPAGNNHYEKIYKIYYKDIPMGIKAAKHRQYLKTHEQEIKNQQNIEKQKKAEEKKAKDLQIKEKLKKAENIEKREIELEKKQKEFEEATKGHIYSTQSSIDVNNIETINETDTLDVKLKKLKKSFDNGEITYQEYKNQRDALLEE